MQKMREILGVDVMHRLRKGKVSDAAWNYDGPKFSIARFQLKDRGLGTTHCQSAFQLGNLQLTVSPLPESSRFCYSINKEIKKIKEECSYT